MRAMPVVLVKPRPEMMGTLLGVFVGAGVGPFAEGGLNEAFGLAIGAWGVRPSALVADCMLLAEIAESPRLVAGTVIGEHAADGDAESLVIGDGGGEEGGGGEAFLIGKDLGEGNAGVIIDGDMHVFPADALEVASGVAGDAVTDSSETAQFLDIEMEQIARSSMFIALDRRCGIEIAQAVEFQSAQDAADGRRAQAGVAGDATGGPTLSAELLDLLNQIGWGWSAQPPGTRTAIAQPSLSFGLKAAHPLGSGLSTDVERGCSRVQRQLLVQNFSCKCLSTPNSKSGILVQVHSFSSPNKQIGQHHQLLRSESNGLLL